jgi:colanic acid biosynthesis glycosyl transferase WcaI
MAAWVSQEIETRGLAHCVHMLGRHPVERMPGFFQHADALLVSLKDEPLFAMTIPGKLQSYLASGIPVLAMLNGEGALVLKNAGAGIVCAAGDHRGLASNILGLAKMSVAERRELGQKGQDLYLHEFNREILMDRLETWLLQLSRRNA